VREILFCTATPGARGDRSQRIDAVVSGVDGGAGDRLSGRSSGRDPGGRAAKTEARSAGCGVSAEATNRKPLSLDLDALDRTARSARDATASSSMGAHADAGTEHAASHRYESRLTAWQLPLEPKRSRGQHAIALLPLAPHAAHRRAELQACTANLSREVDELDERVTDRVSFRSVPKPSNAPLPQSVFRTPAPLRVSAFLAPADLECMLKGRSRDPHSRICRWTLPNNATLLFFHHQDYLSVRCPRDLEQPALVCKFFVLRPLHACGMAIAVPTAC